MARLKIVLLLLLFPNCVPAQTVDTLPSFESLTSSIYQYHNSILESSAKQFADDNRGSWLRFLPSIGVSYVPTLNPDKPVAIRPSVSFSSSNILNFAEQKKLQKQSFLVIQGDSGINAAENIRELKKLLANYEAAIAESIVNAELFEIEKQLFEIQKATYDKGQIPPSKFLAARKKYLVEAAKIAQQKRALAEMRNEILFVAHFEK